MKPTVPRTLLALTLAPALATTASAATALIDFGNGPAPASYNLVRHTAAGSGATSGTVALTDTGGGATGWSASVLETGSGNGGNAGAGANVGTFPAALGSYATDALKDSMYANQGGGSNPQMVLTLTGLDAGASYDILLYGSRGNGQGLDQRWSLSQGTGGADVDHNSGLNSTAFVDWKGVTPNGAGTIEVTISSPGPDSAGALALNFGSITQVPEPSAALLAGLAALSLLARRRR